MRILKTLARLFSLLLTLVLALLLGANLYTLAARKLTGTLQPTVLGFSAAVVVTGSMSPAIEAGDLILCRRAKDYQPGEVICFLSESGSSMITHRIVESGETGFITQGDANNTPDTLPVTPERITGRVVAVIPGFGNFLQRLRTPLGLCLVVLLGFALLQFPRLTERVPQEAQGGNDYGKHSK